MKKVFITSFIALGFTSIISQLVIIKELIISFYGNELFIGLTLFSWLFWVALGSLLIAKLVKFKNLTLPYLLCHLLTPFVLLAEILIFRLARTIIITPGQVPDLIYSFGYVFIIMAPLCLIFGIQFTIASRFWLKMTTDQTASKLVNQAYLLENLGFIFGGIFYAFVLIKMNEVSLALLIALINFLILWLLLNFLKLKKTKILTALLILLVIIFSLTSLPIKLNNQSSTWRFPKQRLIDSKNTLYGNVTITQTDQQFNFYESGLLVGTNSENLNNEILAHFPLLYSPEPKKVLLIGGGLDGIINEIFKHPVEQVYYLELDPKLIELTKDYLSLAVQQTLIDPKVKIINQDALTFLKNTQEQFDVIIINLNNPSIVLLNRYYTEQFYQLTTDHLTNQGILATDLTSSPNYLNKENLKLTASLFWTLKKVFKNLLILPEENIFYLASNELKLDYDPLPLIETFKQRNLNNKLVIPQYLTYRLTNDRVQSTLSQFQQTKIKTNQNLLPLTYFYNNLFFTSQFHPHLTKFLNNLTNFKLSYLIILTLIFFILIIILTKKKRLNLLPITATIPDFTLFTMEITIIYLFQTFFGYVYSQIALIITLLMIGMVLGNYLGIKKRIVTLKNLKTVYLLLVAYCLLLIVIFNSFDQLSKEVSLYLVFPLITLTIGILAGVEFPLTNQLYLQAAGQSDKKTGTVYSADLIGSALGAILTGFIFLPILGVINTLIFLAILNLFVVIILTNRQITKFFSER